MTIEAQLTRCEDRLMEAMKAGDSKVLDTLIHDDLVFVIPTGQTITKAMDIDNYRSGTLSISEIKATERCIHCMDDVAVVTTLIDLKASYHGQMVEGKFRYLRVWKLFNDSWKIITGSGFQIQ